MDRNPYTVKIARGDGLIGRFGDVVMYVGDESASVTRMLEAAESAAGSTHPAAATAERLGALVFGADPLRAPFGLVAPASDGLLLLLRGDLTAEFEAADGVRTLSGGRALTWVDEILPESVHRVAVAGGTGPHPSGCPHTDLRAGVVPGGGFVWCRVDADNQRRTDAAAAPSQQTHETTMEWSPADTASRPIAPARTAAPAAVARALESPDGGVYPLDRDYVIGRDPLRDAAVRDATASPIVVQNDQHTSRVHAYVSVRGNAVWIRDAATPGGTFIAAPGAETWTRIGTAPTELEPGSRLRVGEQILTYHTQGERDHTSGRSESPG